ncbi:MAG: galactose mutarotase [Muribaculaceae bacterium]|nr:galactose mutarotase [Muribaculaceae bacterium]
MAVKIEKVASKFGEITLATITNSKGASVVLSSLGAGVTEINVPDATGNIQNVITTYADPADFMADGPCAGKTPGRYANRIANATFSIDGKEYKLKATNGPHHLHGGPTGFQNRIWDTTVEDDDTVAFTRISPDGEEGYPGALDVRVAYTWNDDNELTIHYTGVTDAPTILNLTNHTYFNLAGENSGDILDHELKLACSRWLPTDEGQIPTGEIATVEGTPMDFTAAKPIGRDINEDFEALHIGRGYDHCFVADNWVPGRLAPIAWLRDPKTGRELTISTTQPAVQLYTANWFGGETPLNPEGRPYQNREGVALECQHFPDSPNHQNFPNTVLREGEVFDETIVFSFKA